MNDKLIEIQNKLRSYLEKEKRKEGLQKLFVWMILFLFLFVFLSILESIFNFSVSSRTFLIIFYLAISFLSLFYFVGWQFIKDFLFYLKPDYVFVAKEIGKHFSEIKDELSNVIQLMADNDSVNSKQLINAAFEKAYQKTRTIDFNSIIDYSKVKKLSKIFFAELLFVFVLFFAFPSIQNATYRLINFRKDFSPPSEFSFNVNPGNVTKTKGENVTVTISITGKQQREIFFFYKTEEESDYTSKKLIANSNGQFVYSFLSLKNSIQYYASAKNISSYIYKITVINRPIINMIDVEIIPPSYTKQQTQFQRDNGNITALAGSKVKLSIYSSRELSKSIIVFNDSIKKEMKLFSNKANFDFNVSANSNYFFEIIDKDGIKSENPIKYSITVESDLSPTIELINPKEDIKLGQENKIPIEVKINDDFGFSKLTLNYKLISSKYRKPFADYQVIQMPFIKDVKEDDVFFNFDLSPLVLAEGEALSFFVEVFDNDIVSGPKSSRTKEIRIIVPSLEELFRNSDNVQQNAADELKETFKDAEKLQQELKKISDDLKQNSREITWQEKEKIEKAAEKFQKIGDRLNEVSQKLSDMQKELMKNNLLSEETISKYNELQKLLDQFNNDDLKNAFKKMQDALKNLMRDNVQMSLEELKANEEFIKNSIERTINLLKRIQVEQKVDELVKRTQDLTEKINDLTEKTENSNLNNTQNKNELLQKQKDVSDKIDQLKESINDLQNKMNDLKDLPKDQLDKIKNEFVKQNNEELSEEALKQLNQLQKMNALQSQKKLSSNLQGMKKQFENLQSQLQQMNQLRSFYEMVKILNNLISISKEEESLKNETEQTSPTINETNKLLKKQNQIANDLLKTLDGMSNLSQKTFAITPEMGKAIGNALNEMKQAQTAIQNQSFPIAGNFQKNAMRSINEAASLLKGSMEQMMNGGKGGGMMSLMQQLQQMAQQQMNLNQLTQMLNQGQMTQEMMAQMQRLAQQQEMIRKSLEQLNNEAKSSGESKKLASNLEKILQEMKEVVSNLQSQKLDDATIKQQERILSKLLDAQRSMNERDFEETRKSSSGENITRNSPTDLNLTSEERKNKLKEELQKALREGYKKDYEELIRKYFELIQKLNPTK